MGTREDTTKAGLKQTLTCSWHKTVPDAYCMGCQIPISGEIDGIVLRLAAEAG